MINAKKFTDVGMVGYGTYVPPYRLSIQEIATTWGKDGKIVEEGLGISQKAVAAADEDSITMGVAAAQQALEMAGINPTKLGAIFMGSESHPYAVKPSGTIIGDILGAGTDYFCADLQFACKAGTAGLQMVAGMIESGMIDYGLVIGSDKAQGRPGDALEYTAAAGAGAVVLGGKASEWVVKLEATQSFSSDTPDFWRRPGENFPAHGGRFTGDPAYFHHVVEGTKRFLTTIEMPIEAFERVVLHMPNVKFPLRAAKILGVTLTQLEAGLVVKEMGNPYSAATFLGLVRTLDRAVTGENILVTAYGSGAGSDSFWWKTTNKLTEKKVEVMRLEREQISYPTYLQMTGEL